MKKYRVRYYIGTLMSLITGADYYEEEELNSMKSEPEFAKYLAQTGFKSKQSGLWIMPGCILTIKEIP